MSLEKMKNVKQRQQQSNYPSFLAKSFSPDPSVITEARCGQWVPLQWNYLAFIPKPLPLNPPLIINDTMLQLLTHANRTIGRLDELIQLLPSPELFIAMYVQKEASYSSQMERIRTSLINPSKIKNPPVNNIIGPVDIDDIIYYVQALGIGMEKLRKIPLSLKLIRECHRILSQGFESTKESRNLINSMTNTLGLQLIQEIHCILSEGVCKYNRDPGMFRDRQSWFNDSGSTIHETTYVPPPPKEMKRSLIDLERFLHMKNDLPRLIQIALIYAQFVMIHPFLDGTGRLARLFISLWLHEQGILRYPVLSISYYFKKYRDEYFALLNKIRESGDWESWVTFFLNAILETADSAVNCGEKIIELEKNMTKNIRCHLKNKHFALAFLDLLFKNPILDMNLIKRKLGISCDTTRDLIACFHEKHILESTAKGCHRHNTYRFIDYINLLQSDLI